MLAEDERHEQVLSIHEKLTDYFSAALNLPAGSPEFGTMRIVVAYALARMLDEVDSFIGVGLTAK